MEEGGSVRRRLSHHATSRLYEVRVTEVPLSRNGQGKSLLRHFFEKFCHLFASFRRTPM